jgi:hypothetical protein
VCTVLNNKNLIYRLFVSPRSSGVEVDDELVRSIKFAIEVLIK